MPINELVAYCRDSIQKDGKCEGCEYDCDNICNDCLQESHFESARTYDCQNMIYCYTGSYIYKYASEITHLFNFLRYRSFESFNILSLGCGSCADLFGINQHLTAIGRNIPVSYTGIDSNDRWQDTQEKIIQIFSETVNYSTSFIQEDIFIYLERLATEQLNEYNIVILQYIINELNKQVSDRMDEFVQIFVQKIVNNLPENSTIIINDINHFNVRRWFDAIYREANRGNLVAPIRKRFTNPTNVPNLDYEVHENDNLTFNTINFGQRIKEPCSSAQFVIYKTKNK
ncbi:MAG TPA: hypothetical protein VIK14_12005 [Ignavibacteria bacterium]